MALALAPALLLGAALRFVDLGAHVPALISPDEPTLVVRALMIAHGRLNPGVFDWPTGSMMLLAALVKASRVLRPAAVASIGQLYLRPGGVRGGVAGGGGPDRGCGRTTGRPPTGL